VLPGPLRIVVVILLLGMSNNHPVPGFAGGSLPTCSGIDQGS